VGWHPTTECAPDKLGEPALSAGLNRQR
jgi:hypothetical protein